MTDQPNDTGDMELFDLRVTVDRIEGRSVCGMAVGDYFELRQQRRAAAAGGQALLRLRAAGGAAAASGQAAPAAGVRLAREGLARCCPDPEERLIMRIERIGTRRMSSDDLT